MNATGLSIALVLVAAATAIRGTLSSPHDLEPADQLAHA